MSKILLVEDDNNLREIYGARLMAEGYKIVAAADGEEALALAVKEKPDLIISDVMMPKISGFDMLDILRTTPETKDTKVIMMTALSQPEDRERGEKLGANRYLVKSQVTLEDVVAVVHEVLEDGGGAAPIPEPTTVNPDSVDPQPAAPAPEPTTPTADPAPAPAPEPAPTPPVPAAPAPAAPAPEPEPTESPPKAPEPAPEVAPAPKPTTAPKPTPTIVQPETPASTESEEPPEPASKKKKIIKPINNLDSPDIQKLAEAEEAKEKETIPGAAIDPQTGNMPDISETIAQEKKEMEDQIKDFVNNEAGDSPAPVADTPATSEPVASALETPTTEKTATSAPSETSEPEAPATDTAPESAPETPPADPNAPDPNDIAL